MVVFNYPTTSLTTTWTTLTSVAIGDSYKRPSQSVTTIGHYGNYVIRVNPNGNFEARTITSTATTAILGIIEYDLL